VWVHFLMLLTGIDVMCHKQTLLYRAFASWEFWTNIVEFRRRSSFRNRRRVGLARILRWIAGPRMSSTVFDKTSRLLGQRGDQRSIQLVRHWSTA
jgi:hypothetical protein